MWHESAIASRAFWALRAAVPLAAAGCLLVLLFRRYRRMPASRRRASAPVLWAAAGPIAVFITGVLLNSWNAPDRMAVLGGPPDDLLGPARHDRRAAGVPAGPRRRRHP